MNEDSILPTVGLFVNFDDAVFQMARHFVRTKCGAANGRRFSPTETRLAKDRDFFTNHSLPQPDPSLYPFLMRPITLQPVGFVKSTRSHMEDDLWDAEKTSIELDRKMFSTEAFDGLKDFSHVEIIFYMNKVDSAKIETGARHPRNNQVWPKVGIFAQRAKNRPNQIGTTVCRILKVEGHLLYLEGLDAIEGTPVLDIKPWVQEFAPRGNVFQPKWITELMAKYWK